MPKFQGVPEKYIILQKLLSREFGGLGLLKNPISNIDLNLFRNFDYMQLGGKKD